MRLGLAYVPAKTTWHTIKDLLSVARKNDKEGPVGRYLVGAKLQIRFPKLSIENKSCSKTDKKLRMNGDYYVGDTIFHVVVAPTEAVFNRCRSNIKRGFRVYLLVPDRTLTWARQYAEYAFSGKIAVESIESFVSQNIEEISKFSKSGLKAGLRELLETYNRRVDEISLDKSLMVDIPRGLL
jgi:hypothetical protein